MSHPSSFIGQDLEQYVENFSELTREIGDVKSVEGLMELLCNLWQESFGISTAFFFELENRGDRITAEAATLIAENQIATELTEGLLKDLSLYSIEAMLEDGIHSFKIGSSFVNLFFFSYEEIPTGVFCWLNPRAGTPSRSLDLAMTMVLELGQQVSRWCLRLQESQAMIYRDDLTNVYNYRYLDVCLDNEIRRVHRFPSAFSLLFIDLDSFKPINDTHGHLAGSSVLCQLADLLRGELRDVDSIFRYGGDEFVIMLLEAGSKKAHTVGERIRDRVANYQFSVSPDTKVRLTVSIGISCCPEHSLKKEELLQLADESMYKGKRSGKNRVAMTSHINGTNPNFMSPPRKDKT